MSAMSSYENHKKVKVEGVRATPSMRPPPASPSAAAAATSTTPGSPLACFAQQAPTFADALAEAKHGGGGGAYMEILDSDTDDEAEAALDASGARHAAEAAYELEVWGGKNAAPVPLGSSIAFEETFEKALDHKASYADAVEQRLSSYDLEPYRHVSPTVDALLSGPDGKLRLSARRRPHVDPDGRPTAAVVLAIEVRFTPSHADLDRRGVDGLQQTVAALIAAQQRQGVAVCAARLKSTGLMVPPRAARLPPARLRTVSGLLDAMEMEGSCAGLPEAPEGLAKDVTLGDYQLETLAWMLAREKSKFGLEDLFCTDVGGGATALSMPAPLYGTRHGGDVKTRIAGSAQAIGGRHRGGILAEEMGMGKSVECLALVLAHKPDASWVAQGPPGLRQPTTLILVPQALLGQWAAEIASRAPGLTAAEWPKRSRQGLKVDICLATYGQAAAVAAAGLTWWRACCDEPQGSLTAQTRAGYINMAAATTTCARIDAPLRWCITGTPVGNAVFDVFGQLAFLRIIGADDDGARGEPRVLTALHFRTRLSNNFYSPYNCAAEVIASVLKPLVVRHTKTQTRSGKALLSLKPTEARTVLVAQDDAVAYAHACEAARGDRARVHRHAHALRPLWELCSGVANMAAAADKRNLGMAKASCLGDLAVALPARDDFDPDVQNVPSEELQRFKTSVRFSPEADCAACLCRLDSRVASPSTCGHLFCESCCLAFLDTGTSPADDLVRERVGVRVTGISTKCLTSKTAREQAKTDLLLALRDLSGPSRDRSVYVNGDGAFCCFSLKTRALEDAAIEALTARNDVFTPEPGETLPAVAASRVSSAAVAVPCPFRGCGALFAKTDVLRVTRDVLDRELGSQNGWPRIVREFVVAHHKRKRLANGGGGALFGGGGGGGGGGGAAAAAAAAAADDDAVEVLGSAEETAAAQLAAARALEKKMKALRARVAKGMRGGSVDPAELRALADGEEELKRAAPVLEAAAAAAAAPAAAAPAAAAAPPRATRGSKRKAAAAGGGGGGGAAAADDAAGTLAEAAAVGVRVRRRFPGYGFFTGRIASRKGKTGWNVVWEDGATTVLKDKEAHRCAAAALAAAAAAGEAPPGAASPAAAAAAAAPAPALRGKMDTICDLVAASRAAGDRCVVFTAFPEAVQAIVDRVCATDRAVARGFTANTPRAERENAVTALERGAIDALVVSIRAGAVGLNLTAASHVIFAAPLLDRSLQRQAVARLHRIGQKKSVRVTTLAAEGTLEQLALSLADRDVPPRDIGDGTGVVHDQVLLRTAALHAKAVLAQY